ncbi:MAG TPA: hypothetical protein VHT25_02845 [Solirubrobacteraceae bacterium]|nr:hypothetical protein [Solirubrobacteraceae bacterium]
MGLLDDAIREHLELKRRRGADPGEVAREQREALDVDENATTGEAASSAADTAVVAAPPAATDSNEADQEPAGTAGEPAAPQPAQAGALGETAELDMTSVLGDEQTKVAADEDSLEWEVPGEGVEAEPEPEEDVLEETPDFLRDTPEQDRLWFEQRPPRDFDFDK